MVVGWDDAGRIGTGVAGYLISKLGAEEFAEIEPQKFSIVPYTLVKDGVVEEIDYPDTSFHYYKNKGSSSDLIIFDSPSPPQNQHEYADLVLDLAELFKVKRIYSAGGIPANIPHDEEPALFAVANSSRVKRYIKPFGVEMGLDYYGPTSMNGLLLGLARQRSIDALSIFGWVPCYISEIPNPRICEAVLRVLSRMLNVDIDFEDIEAEAEFSNKQINEVVAYIREQNPDFDRNINRMGISTAFQAPEEDRRRIFMEIQDFLRKQHGSG
ncbi:MAG: PAC2 family protein [Dehalococcoidales bacterium]|nr:PAC2 family protein [Dehalococcoidales bacterium]